MRLCAGGITDCEGGGLCQRYGWTGRRTARVAHKRAGRRLRLQSDLERFPTLLRPLRSQRAPVEGAGGDTKRRIHLAATRLLQPASRRPFGHCLPTGLGTYNAVLFVVSSGAAQSQQMPSAEAAGMGCCKRGALAALHACTLAVWAFGKLAGVDRPGGLAV